MACGFEEHGNVGEEHDQNNEEVAFAQQKFNPCSSALGFVWEYRTGYNLG